MADIAHTPHAGAGSIPTHSASQSSLPQRIWRAKRYYLYLVPIFALLGIFSYYPPLMALYYSLSNFNGVQLRLIDLFQDRLFLTSVGNVLKLMVANVLTGLIPPLLAAELIFLVRSQRAANFYRTMFLIPTLVPAMVVILTWRYIYHARYGLINTVLDGIGLDSLRHDWLGSFDTALLSLMFFGFPWIHGASLLILLAGLINIPNEIFDSYRMDAGWGIRRIWHIDLPLILGAVRAGDCAGDHQHPARAYIAVRPDGRRAGQRHDGAGLLYVPRGFLQFPFWLCFGDRRRAVPGGSGRDVRESALCAL